MDKKFNYEDIIFRLGYFRNKNNLSARETSLRLGYSASFINRIERKKVELKTSALVEFLDLIEISPVEFFYSIPEHYEQDKALLKSFNQLSNENKEIVIELIKKLK